MPDLADSNWGVNVTDYLVALATGSLQKAGGAFTLTGEVDFGGTYGLKSLYFKTKTATPAITGVLRLAKTDTIAFRNNANNADISLRLSATDNLQFAGAEFIEGAAPATPAAGSLSIYAKADHKFYQKDSTGLEKILGGGGLTPISKTANYTAVTGDMVECDTTGGAFTITLPSGTSAAVIGILDAGPYFQTNNLIVAPASGQSIDNDAANNTLTMDVNRANAIFYRAEGATVWEVQFQALTLYSPGFVPGYNGAAAISTGNIGETSVTTSATASYAATGTWENVTSKVLAAGVYLASADLNQAYNSATTNADLNLAISGYSGTTTTDHAIPLNAAQGLAAKSNTDNVMMALANVPVRCDGTNIYIGSFTIVGTTLYLKSKTGYTGTAPQRTGSLKIVRIA